MQHRANRNVRGRHRRRTPLHSHRAPSTPVTEKGRYAVAAALVAGVGVAGLTTATDGASSAPATTKTRQAAAAASLAPSAPAPAPTPTVTPSPTLSPSPSAPSPTSASIAGVLPVDEGLPFVPQARKEKPLPPLPLWVNPMPEGATTSCFGPRWGRLHAGVDLAAPEGTPIRAVGAGVVVTAGPAEGYGNAVLIDHGNGYLTHYGHMSVITATVGQHVAAGDQIGDEGSTGHSTGPHLHFEVHQGAYKNPIEPTAWMRERGIDITGCATPAEAS
ncbi:M23 family metallopeptidase [Actinoplanes auranticolor]|uniref:M23ase beta-sheet core domain-containing protein n=1 Tax=Actinoplanes auranticolor TaxID=47988 RepID=A0A919S3S1_9ACTN|nr:M23 family metallopeptidase [Actinoplanes auranticolor]GIM63691.1 hypothetical protein Aau02nite_05690 [Actinoplanes auranticolor]